MTLVKQLTKIYIIESPRDTDLLDNRIEGHALFSTLNLAGINNQYFQVVTKNSLENTFARIVIDINNLKSQDLVAPYLHFSAHGNENGFGLSNGEFITWDMLRDYLDNINREITFIRYPGYTLDISLLNLSFSVCKGFNAKKMQDGLDRNIYSSLVGPIESVDWADSLIAYSTLFHQIFYKGKRMIDSISIMNSAAGLSNIFQHSLGYGLKYN